MAPIKKNNKNKIKFPDDNKNFDEQMKQYNTSIVKFFSPQCGHCVAMKNAWDSLDLDDVGIFEVDVTKNPVIPQTCNISPDTGVPHIILIDSLGNKKAEYNGDRTTDDMKKFVLDNKSKSKKQTKKISGGSRSKRSMKKRSMKKRSRMQKRKTQKNKQK
jgi:thioredoxin-like negative regulator of GroEL